MTNETTLSRTGSHWFWKYRLHSLVLCSLLKLNSTHFRWNSIGNKWKMVNNGIQQKWWFLSIWVTVPFFLLVIKLILSTPPSAKACSIHNSKKVCAKSNYSRMLPPKWIAWKLSINVFQRFIPFYFTELRSCQYKFYFRFYGPLIIFTSQVIAQSGYLIPPNYIISACHTHSKLPFVITSLVRMLHNSKTK